MYWGVGSTPSGNKAIIVTATGAQAKGTTTNDNAATGYVGEYVSSTLARASAISLTTLTGTNITSINLTAGDWDVSGAVTYIPAATTTISYLMQQASASSGAMTGSSEDRSNFPHTNGTLDTSEDPTIQIPIRRFSLSSTTTVYLVTYTKFGTSTLSAYGGIRARRVR